MNEIANLNNSKITKPINSKIGSHHSQYIRVLLCFKFRYDLHSISIFGYKIIDESFAYEKFQIEITPKIQNRLTPKFKGFIFYSSLMQVAYVLNLVFIHSVSGPYNR